MYPVVFENVSKQYGGKEVLSVINLEIPENKITAVIGKSGSGKSTILKMINGLVKPSSGKIFIFGKEINYNDIQKIRLNIGYSVQGSGLFPHLNVFENITLLAKLNGNSSQFIKERSEKLLKLVNIPIEFFEKYPNQLSGGEQQRVGICRAMMLNPKLFLLDEAFGSLDPTTKAEIHSELLKIQLTEPRTLIIVTHDLHEAFKLADKIIILEKGVIQQYGSKDEIVNYPANGFVKNFLNSQSN